MTCATLLNSNSKMKSIFLLVLSVLLRYGFSNAKDKHVTVMEQSNSCTPEENLKQIQCLRELPAELYEVLEGEDVQMRCRVAHQRGKAQWRAGNFLLGHTRSIPGWERYSLQGEPRLGIHDLVIQNVTNEDAGTFECQVSPAEGQGPLRRQTVLSILVKPSPPVITTPSGEPHPTHDGQLIVPVNHMKDSTIPQPPLRLFCQSKGGQPPPKFQWFHNGQPLDLNETVGENDVYTIEHSDDHSSAELVMKREVLRTGDRLACIISNKATLRSRQLSMQKLRSELLVMIHSAPGNPEIIDWTQRPNRSHIFTIGSTLEATCRCSPAGNPPGELVWRWEKHQKPGVTSKSPFARSAIDATSQIPVPSESVIHQFDEEKLLSKVTIPSLNSSHHDLNLVCAVKHQVGPEKTTQLAVFVRYGPNSALIDGPEETIETLKRSLLSHLTKMSQSELVSSSTTDVIHQRYVYEDRPQYLLCIAGPYFDSATIKWFGFLNISGQWQELSALETFSRVLESGSHNYVLASIVQLVSTNTDHTPLRWTTIKCLSEPITSTELDQEDRSLAVVRKIELKNFEPPGKPIISGVDQEILYPEGTNLTVTCEADSGKPVGRLVWSSGEFGRTSSLDRLLANASTNHVANGRMWSKVKLILAKEVNGIEIRCTSMNEGYKNSDRLISSPVLLNVAFAPAFINLTVADESGRPLFPRDGSHPRPTKPQSDSSVQFDQSHDPPVITADAGTAVSVTCKIEHSHPRPKIEWRLRRCTSSHEATANEASTYRDRHGYWESCDTVNLEGMEVPSGNKLTIKSNLQLSLNWSHHHNLVECFTGPVPTYDVTDRNIPPKTSSTPNNPKLLQRLLLNVRFKPVFLNPKSSTSDRLLVEHNPTSQPQYVTGEGGSLELKLEPLANPAPHKFVWLKNRELLVYNKNDDADQRIFIQDGLFKVHPVRTDDMANYTVMATNVLGTGQMNFFMNVTYGPKLLGRPHINITASGRKVQLDCQARANPVPSETAVRWRRMSHSFGGLDGIHLLRKRFQKLNETVQQDYDSEADSIAGVRCNKGKWHSGFKYFVKCWSPSEGTLASSLTIYDLGSSDVGRYQCYMENAIGSPAIRIVDLIYPFVPKVIPIGRWSRAAPGPTVSDGNKEPNHEIDSNSQGSKDLHAELRCVIAAEPMPNVEWSREPANLTLVEGGQFRSEIKVIQPGLYHSILHISQPKESDRGRYFCKASNTVGHDVALVELVESTHPDVPNIPRLINATSSSLAVSWTQGFNGGLRQSFQLRWAPNDDPIDVNQVDLQEDMEKETIDYIIKGLQKATSYRISVSARNQMFGSTIFTPYFLASTKAYDPIPDKEAMHDEAKSKLLSGTIRGHWDTKGHFNENGDSQQIRTSPLRSGDHTRDSKTVSIIVVACVFGALVLLINLFIVFLLTNRRRKKNSERNKTTIISANDMLMKMHSAGPSFTEMAGIHRPAYSTCVDGSSLSGDGRLNSRLTDQFSNLHADLNPLVPDMMVAGNHPNAHPLFAGSPHPSLQAINPLVMHSSNHMEFNPSSMHPQPRELMESDLARMSFANDQFGYPGSDYNGHPMFSLPIHQSEILQNVQSVGSPERRTPTTNQIVYPMVQRIDSPHSGGTSSIWATRSAGYSNSHSLERNGYALTPGRSSHNHNNHMTGLVRQSSFGHHIPNGTFGRTAPEYYAQNCVVSTFTPNQTLQQNRTRINPMVSSFFVDRNYGAVNNCNEQIGHGEAIPSMNTCQIVRKGSHNRYKPHDMSIPMNGTSMHASYLQRYNEQLQCIRALGRTGGTPRHGIDAEGNCNISPRIVFDQPHSADSMIIPPPNVFSSNQSRQFSPCISRQVMEDACWENAEGTTFTGNAIGADSNACELSINTAALRETQLSSVAPIKHPIPDHSLMSPNESMNSYVRSGCVV